MAAKITIFVVVGVGIILSFATLIPSRFDVEKTAIIHAPPEKVFALIADSRSWRHWAPQEGQGGVESEADRLVLVTAAKPWHIDFALDKPFGLQGRYSFTLAPASGGTAVVEEIEGTNSYLMKVIEVFVGQDRLIGGYSERDLRSLKTTAESPESIRAKGQKASPPSGF